MNPSASRRLAAFLATLILAAGLAVGTPPAVAGEVIAAVASNFQATAGQLAAAFERQTGHQVRLSFGSTGQLYAQIRNGAPFDVFFAADEARPRKLDAAGIAIEGSRFTYARGRLVLWSARPDYVVGDGKVLREGGYRHIAIANPKLAPYGRAAKQALMRLGLWETLQDDGRLVMGQNIGQTHQLIASTSVPLGFVALSQIQQPGHDVEGSHWPVPPELHEPIVQQAVLIHDTPAARALVAFVRGETGRRIIDSYGYAAPTGKE